MSLAGFRWWFVKDFSRIARPMTSLMKKEKKFEWFNEYEQAFVTLKERILDAHTSKFSVHPGGDKMYQDLKLMFWWSRMNKDIDEYVSRCLTCRKVKSKHR